MEEIFSKISKYAYHNKNILISVLFLLLFFIPFLGFSAYIIRVLCLIATYAILGLSLNLMTGYMGMTSMGHAALYCIGAYAGTLFTVKLGTSFWISMLAAIIFSALAGAFEGFITMGLSGSYMTVTTLAFAQVTTMVAKNWVSLTNGPLGVKNIPHPRFFGITLNANNGGLFWLILVLLGITILFISAMINSKIGRAIVAIKEDELAAKLMGIRTKKFRVANTAISGAIAGVAGCYYAHMSRYIDPNVFSFDVSMTILTIVIFGGLASIPGAIIGAVIMITFPEVLRFLTEYRFLVYGIILVVMMRFRPQGVMGGLSKHPYKLPAGVSSQLRESTNEGKEL